MWNETGIGRYIRNVVKQISLLDTKNGYTLFFLPKNIDSVSLPNNFRLVPANIRWHTFAEQTKLASIYLKENLDLLHVPHFNVPIFYTRPFVATIHDLTILRMRTGRATTLPYPIYQVKRMAFNMNLLSTVHRAKKLFTVSDFVKQDIVSTLGVKGDKIVLTPNAVDAAFKPAAPNEVQEVLARYGIAQPYLFYIGNADPHKNLEGLIQAFTRVSGSFPDLQLVLAGSKNFFYDRLEREWQTHPIINKLRFIGYVDDADLPVLYTGAEAFVNPSFFEGFGIQLLEAFACGTRVICSNTTSLPEIGGSAAHYFDPYSVDDMVTAITTALKEVDSAKRVEGFKIAQKFSWETSAKTILQVYENCLSL